MRPRFAKNLRPENRGRGECRAPDAPAASCALLVVSMHTSIHSEPSENTRHSRTQWFTAYTALSPVIGFLATVAGGVASTALTPAPGCQAHTSSPSAKSVLSSVAPPASTASRPAFVTIACAPLSGRDGERYTTDLRLRKTRIFFQMGL